MNLEVLDEEDPRIELCKISDQLYILMEDMECCTRAEYEVLLEEKQRLLKRANALFEVNQKWINLHWQAQKVADRLQGDLSDEGT